VTAAFRLVFRIEAKLQQCVVVRCSDKSYVTAAPSITAAGTTARDELLPAERQTAIAAVSGLYENASFVEKLHRKAAGPDQSRRPIKMDKSLPGNARNLQTY
jgi:hypothetical protein